MTPIHAFTEAMTQQKGAKDDTYMGNAEKDLSSRLPDSLVSELAQRLVETVDRLNHAEYASEAHRMAELGALIRSARHQCKMSRAELATQTGLPFPFLIALENGLVTQEEMSMEQLRLLSNSLAIPMDSLSAFLDDEGSSITESRQKRQRRVTMDKKQSMKMALMRSMKAAMMMMGMLVMAVAMGRLAKRMASEV